MPELPLQVPGLGFQMPELGFQMPEGPELNYLFKCQNLVFKRHNSVLSCLVVCSY
jgi:hypothetical protein